MARKKKLNIPIYDVRADSGRPAEFDEDDIIDAELLNDGSTMGQRAREGAAKAASSSFRAARSARVHGVKDTLRQGAEKIGVRKTRESSTNARAERERRAKLTEEQRVYDKGVGKEQAETLLGDTSDPLINLRRQTAKAGQDYMASVRRSNILHSSQTRESQAQKLSGMNQVYASMMVLQCVDPLKRGLSSANIANTLGMGASMWLLSPNFRTQIGSFAKGIGEELHRRIDSRSAKKDNKALRKVGKAEAKGKSDLVRDKWRKRVDKIEHAQRGCRDPFTAESAAMTEIALAETAYVQMRRPGADPALVRQQYDTAMSTLYGYVSDDGLESADVSRAMRTMVGQRLEREPGLASVFAGLSHGQYTKSAPHEVDGQKVWMGDFVGANGAKVTAGSFTLRDPKDLTDHRAAVRDTILMDMSSCKNLGDLNDALSQYAVGSAANDMPNIAGLTEDPATAQRLTRAQMMFASMEADGLTGDERHLAYTMAYVDAVETAQSINPDLGLQWSRMYGENWKEDMTEKMNAFRDMGDKAAPSHSAPGPQGGPQPRTGYPAGWGEDDEFHTKEEDIVDAEIVEDDEPVAESERSRSQDDLADNLRSTSTKEQRDSGVDINDSAVAKIRRARVNQHYNDIDTGSITGIGRDDSTPLQDPDFSLGG